MRIGILEERILEFMQASPGTPYSDRQVGRAVDRQRSREEPRWARPLLEEMVRLRKLICDASGYYFQFPTAQQKSLRTRRAVMSFKTRRWLVT